MGAYFEIGLFIALVASAIIGGLDKWVFEKRRPPNAKMPFMADYARSLFSVFLIVLVLRSFVAEPYQIPSGSMLPDFEIGDFILVNKFSYGLRLPVWHNLILKAGEPKRGDVVVLHYPVNPQADFIKRVIAVPGDTVSYINKVLYVNGEMVPQKLLGQEMEIANSSTQNSDIVQETLGTHTYNTLLEPWTQGVDFKNLVVPQGEYFVMGDNRDNSDDSRFWGFVPESAMVGRTFMIWFSWDSENYKVRWSRIGKVVH